MPFLFTLLAFILASLFGAGAAFAQPACDPGFADDGDTIAAATDVDDDNDGLIEICNLLGLDSIRNKLDGTAYKGSDPDGSGSMTAPAETSMGCPDTGCTGYELTEDLDFTDSGAAGYNVVWTAEDPAAGSGWTPIGGIIFGSGLGGDFEGNGFEIHNLYFKNTNPSQGLFTVINSGAEVRNLGLLNVNVSGSSGVSTLASANKGSVSGCHSSGLVTTTHVRIGLSGGLLGTNSGMVTDCHTTVNIDATVGGHTNGGLIGENENNGSVTRCYATGNLDGPANQFGGLIGSLSSGNVTSCYATGSVGGSGANRGGLVGIIASGGAITSSYSTGAVSGADGGGLVGSTSTDVTLSYWDTQTSGKTDSAGGSGAMGKDTDGMKALTTGAFGAKDSDWDFGDNTQYPALKKGGSTTVAGQPCPRAECFFGGGVGIQADPYQIFTIAHLNAIRGDFLDDHFVLMNDLDFDDHTYADTAKGWLPIGDATTPFSGSFDGGGYVIRNLFINRGGARVGLFGQLGATGSLEDLGVEDVVVEGQNTTGGLVGETLESATITLCHATGVVTSRSEHAGVLVGKNAGTITLCHATGAATGQGNGNVGILVGWNTGTIRSSHSAGSAESSGSEAGGLVGRNVRGTITSCYSTGRAEGSREVAVGGLVGFSNGGAITWCYATGQATVRFEGAAGGLVGQSSAAITSCYSTGSAEANGTPKRGLVGTGSGIVLNSFWDTDTSGITTTGEGTGKTTAEMKALTLEMLGDSGGLSWDVGNENQYPAVRSYKDDGGSPAAQVAGDVLVGQPCPRAGVCNVFVGGTGTEGDPYQISSLKQLDAIRGDFLDNHFVLVNDLDFDDHTYADAAKGWLPIGDMTTPFSGSFDGGGYVIRNLFIMRTDEDYVGLFGALSSTGSLKNLGVKDVAVEGDKRVGGLAGELSGWLRSCYATGQVTGTEFVGGLLGYSIQGRIISCFSTGAVTGSTAGGFVGNNEGTIQSCYSTGSVTGGSAPGGFAGANVGEMVTLSFWDTEASGITTAGGGTGKTTAEIKALTLGDLGDLGGLSWDVGTIDQYPEVRTYDENEAGDQVQGDVISGQPCPRSHCEPLVNIAPQFSPINEGFIPEFNLTRTGPTAAELRVEVTLTGSHYTDTAPSEYLFSAGRATLNVSVRSENEMDEADWTLTATITAEPSSFRLENASASITVTDNDLPSIISFEIGGSSGRIDEDADSKTITVTVAEGTSLVGLDPTVVTVRSDATVAPSGMVTFVDGTAQPYTVTAGGDTVTYQVTVNVVAGTPPGVPGGFSAVAGVEQVTLAWTEPTVLGSTGTLVRYEYRQTQGVAISPWTAVEPLTALTQVVGSLMAGVVYGFEVRAVGSNELAGEATAKEEVTAVGALMFMGTIADQTYTKDTAIMNLVLPEATGGTGAYTYTLTPVPAGLMFNSTSRTLSGTPTEATTATYTYTVTDTTTTLTKTLTFTITVTAGGSPMFSDPVPNQSYTQDTAITDLVLPAATGGMGALTYALIPVPAGLMFDATSRTLSGMPTMVADPATTHTYTVTDTATTLTASLTFMITVNAAEDPTFGIGSEGGAVHVYPNPAGDVLCVEFSGAGEYGITVLTVAGQQVFGGQHAGGGTKKLDVSTLKGGVYFLKIEDSEGGSHTVRILR